MDSNEQEGTTYEKPTVVDYGSLIELTAALTGGHHFDGLMHDTPDHVSLPIP
jgi:hypothetical protein